MPLPISPGRYDIDTSHTQLGFAVTHLGISTIRGTFDRYTGALEVGDDLGATAVSVDAEMESINSGNPGRDQHMFGPDFLDTANHPSMTFRSAGIQDSGGQYVMDGHLTIRGITQPVTLHVTFNGESTFPMDGSTHFGFCATGSISRSAFGVSYGVPLVSDEVALTLDVQFVRPGAKADAPPA